MVEASRLTGPGQLRTKPQGSPAGQRAIGCRQEIEREEAPALPAIMQHNL